MKKELSILLLICILNALNINAATYSGSCGANVRYSLDTSTGLLSITGTGAMTNYSSSSNVPWYSYTSYIKTVEITNGITSIGSSAFSGCSGLESVIIPKSVTSIGNSAFEGCGGELIVNCNIPSASPTSGAFYGSKFKSVKIGESVTSIGNYAFYGCSNLTSITIPNSVTSIGSSAFRGCSGLTSITIPNSVTSIGSHAFSGCSGLTSFIVAAGNTIYDSRNDCNALIETATNTLIAGCKNTVIPNSVTSIGQYAFSGCSSLTSVTIPNSVISIGVRAFEGCYGLTSVHITDLAAWCNIAFAYVYVNNTSTIWYSNPLYYAHHLFMNGKEITELVIPNGVTEIKEFAFSNCSGLTSIEIPNSVTSIGQFAFSDCSGLAEVYCDARNVPNTNTTAFDNTNISSATLIVPASSIAAYQAAKPWNNFGIVKAILNGSCGENVNFTLDTETGVLSITGTGAMTNYSSSSNVPWYSIKSYIKSVEITDSVTSIGERAFYNCSGLTSVTIPNSVTSIGYYAFRGCSGLTSVTIPNSVTSIGDYAFMYCSGLTKVTLNSNAIASKAYSSSSTIGNIFGSQVKEYILGDKVTSIGSYAFYNCSTITSVTISESVTSIGNSAFNGCSALTEVYCNAENVPNMGTGAFNNINIANATLYLPAVSVAAYMTVEPWSRFGTVEAQGGSTIYNGACGDNVRYSHDTGTGVISIIGTGAMTNYSNTGDAPWYEQRANIKSVEIADGVTSIGERTFRNCNAITSISISNSVKSINSYAFSNCSGLTSVTIPNGVTSIGLNAFDFNLTSIVVASGNAKFDSRDNCNAVIETATNTLIMTCKNTVIPNSVSCIGDYAFYRCPDFSSVTIPNSVKSIGDYAFYNCSSLTSVDMFSNIESIGTAAFKGTTWYDNQPDGMIYVGKVFYKYKGTMPENTSITIDEGTLCIAGSAFSSCSGLVSVTIHNSVKSIGDDAFSDCSGLTKVTINSNAIASKAYSSSSTIGKIFGSQVKEYIFGDDVKSIGSYAFSGCSTITSITIPNNVTSIGESVFSGCSKLTEVYCNAENVPTTSTDVFNNANIANATLYVPAASVAAYMAVDPWRKFGTVKTQGGSEIYNGSCGTNVRYSLDTGTGALSITGTGAMTKQVPYPSLVQGR